MIDARAALIKDSHMGQLLIALGGLLLFFSITSSLKSLNRKVHRLMSSFDDAKAAQAATDAKIDAVAADVKGLMDKLAAVPAAGMTPEQQAALDDVVAHAQAINDKLSGIDATVNPPAPAAS